jgi:hypothetical protein
MLILANPALVLDEFLVLLKERPIRQKRRPIDERNVLGFILQPNLQIRPPNSQLSTLS